MKVRELTEARTPRKLALTDMRAKHVSIGNASMDVYIPKNDGWITVQFKKPVKQFLLLPHQLNNF
jgi:hypothetical protein